MKSFHVIGVALALTFQSALLASAPLGSAFTYQGRLSDGGIPASGNYDLTFTLLDAAEGGNAIGPDVYYDEVLVSDGLFTVDLDFGTASFNGDARWLEISVNGTALSPRQPVTPTPYAVQTRGIHVNDWGDVGMGTTEPAANLHVASLYATDAICKLESALLSAPSSIAEPPHVAGPLNDFVPIGNILTNDSAYASVSIPSDDTRELQASDLGFDIPEDAIIEGIEVRIERKMSGIAFLGDESIELLGGLAASDDLSTGDGWGVFDELATYGGPTELWGLSWTAQEINDPAFGILLAVSNNNSLFSGTALVDFVEVEVFYSVVDDETHEVDLRLSLDGLHVDFAGESEPQTLIVGGTIESAAGGFRFPDGTVQASAAVASNQWNETTDGIDYQAGNVGIGKKADANFRLYVSGDTFFGDGDLTVYGDTSTNTLTILGGADVAEPFIIAPTDDIQPVPGMVVAIDAEHVGRLRVASHPYDRSVAGIISGANGINPGLVLAQKGTVADGSMPVASAGRVWCYCDADAAGPIMPGDLLTTSSVPGHAMRVREPESANGAILGKAMSSLEHGKGLVLVLVSLQ